MKTITIQTRIENGEFKANRKAIRKAIEANEGKSIEIIFKRKYIQRSHPQNRFYWGVIIPLFQELILEHWGEIRSKEDIHELLKTTCNFDEKINPSTGEVVKVPKSSTELSTTGWLEYEQKIKQLALDFFQAVIPEPNEQLELNFK